MSNCFMCGRFMRHADLEEHPDVDNEFYLRLECGAVDHQYMGEGKE